jgi:hypothetical protein
MWNRKIVNTKHAKKEINFDSRERVILKRFALKNKR